jgi:hypothetical protein
VAAAGSPALLALQQTMVQGQLGHVDGQLQPPSARAKNVGMLRTKKHLSQTEMSMQNTAAVAQRWERLVRLLLPQHGAFVPTVSLNTSDYPARRPVHTTPARPPVHASRRGGRARTVSAHGVHTRGDRVAEAEARKWTKVHVSLRDTTT